MSNEYYMRGDAIQPFTLADARQLVAEFTKLEQAFDKLPAQELLNSTSYIGLFGNYSTNFNDAITKYGVDEIFICDESGQMIIYVRTNTPPGYEAIPAQPFALQDWLETTSAAIIATAQGHKEGAQAAQAGAVAAQGLAQTAATDAQAAQAGAVAAQGLAQTAVTDAQAAANLSADYGNMPVYRTWALLNAVVGAADDMATILADTGTHTDPVVGGTVSNSGLFSYSASPAGWRRDANTTAVDAGAAAQAWAEGTLPGGAGTKSAKEHALAAGTSRDLADAAAAIFSEALGPLYDLIGADAATVFSRGSHTATSASINASLKGWRAPFNHDGDAFNVVEFTIKAQAAGTRVLVKIMDVTRTTELARGYALVGTSATTIRPVLNKVVRVAANTVLYISYEPADAGGVLSYASGGTYTDGADPATNREYYMDAAGAWQLPSPAGNFCIQFRAMYYEGVIAYGDFARTKADIATALSLLTGGVQTVYDLPGYTAHPLTYSNAGVGAQVPAQASAYSFNRVTVWGGMNGAGVLRGYAVATSVSAIYVPASSGTLLFSKAVNWTSDVTERQELLDSPVTVPANMELHLIWVSNIASNVSVARWDTNTPGTLPKMLLCTTSAGDETGIWDDTWYDGGTGYWTVPTKLELVAVAASAEVTATPFFTIPANIKATVGTELCLQYDSICSASSLGLAGLRGYSAAIVGPKGRGNERFFSFTPLAGDIGTHTFTAKLFDAAGEEVATRTFTITVVAATAKGSARNVVLIGDSLTAGDSGRIAVTAQAAFAALGATVPTFVGSQGSSPAKHEGFGGKSFAWFATSGGLSYRVTVSGVSVASVGAVVTVSGINYTVMEVNITAGAGNLLLSGASAPPGSGTLTKVSGTIDTTITFSASATVPGNPLWNAGTGALDIAAYRTAQSVSGNIHAVMVMLGINDVFGESLKNTAQITTMVDYAKDIADAFLADNASCKVVFVLPSICGNTADGFAANYGATYSRAVFESNIFALRTALIAAFDAGAYGANVSIGAGGLAVDRYYGYARSSSAVSSRITASVEKHVNGVHPATEGYRQFGDQFYAELMAHL